MSTGIEWTHRPGTIGESWNMIGGCTKVSDGCINCYALPTSWRIQNNPNRPDRYEGIAGQTECDHPYLPEKHFLQWTGRVNLDYDALQIPYRWKAPRTVFVCSMADLFHPKAPDQFISRAFQTMFENRRHTFLVLTKRATRMRNLMSAWKTLPNVWLGVSTENQEQADKRIPDLLQTPAAVRFVSVEPMLGPVRWLTTDNDAARSRVIGAGKPHEWRPTGAISKGIDWLIIGCESGPNRRPMELEWALDLVRQCDAANVAVFVKQLPINGRVSHDPNEWPAELQRREYPK